MKEREGKKEQIGWNWDHTRWFFAVGGTTLVLMGVFSWFLGNQDGHLTSLCITLWVLGAPILLCSLLIEGWKKQKGGKG